jgi:hypothetical protein
MAQQIPVHLKYRNRTTLENDHLLPTTLSELVTESDEKQFVSKRQKEYYGGKQDALGYTPLNQDGDTMNGPLILSRDAIVEDKQAATKEYVDQKIADLVEGSPSALDTIYELAAAIDNDPNFAVSVSSVTGTKLDKTAAEVIPKPNKLLYLDSNAELNTNAATASKLKNGFTLTLTGDAIMNPVQIDGSDNVTGIVTIDQLSNQDIETIFRQT